MDAAATDRGPVALGVHAARRSTADASLPVRRPRLLHESGAETRPNRAQLPDTLSTSEGKTGGPRACGATPLSFALGCAVPGPPPLGRGNRRERASRRASLWTRPKADRTLEHNAFRCPPPSSPALCTIVRSGLSVTVASRPDACPDGRAWLWSDPALLRDGFCSVVVSFQTALTCFRSTRRIC